MQALGGRDALGGQGVAWTNLIANLLLAIMKIAGGVIFFSQAVLADGLHSASDAIGSAAVLYGRRLAATPPDDEHPYGHEKAESIAAFGVGVFLVAAGMSVAADALLRLSAGVHARPDVGAVWVAALGIVVKELLFRWTRWRNRALASVALSASAQDSRVDVWSSAAALLGVVSARAGWGWADPAMAIVVAGLLVLTGVGVLRGNLHDLLEGRQAAVYETVRQTVLAVPGVLELHDLRTRGMGRYVLIDVKIGVDGQRTVAEGHAVARAVVDAVHEQFPDVREVLVHVNPASRTGEDAAHV